MDPHTWDWAFYSGVEDVDLWLRAIPIDQARIRGSGVDVGWLDELVVLRHEGDEYEPDPRPPHCVAASR